MWVETGDFQKAFGSIEHTSLWESLKEQSVSESYIRLLKKMYVKQMGMDVTGVQTGRFEVRGGTWRDGAGKPIELAVVQPGSAACHGERQEGGL